MSSHPPGDTDTSLSRLVDEVETHGQTLTLYNTTAGEQTVEPIVDRFGVTTVSVRRGETDDGRPENFAVLHDDDGFVAACGLEALSAAVDPTRSLADPGHLDADQPDLLAAVDESVFTEYGKRRMILASREVEKRAWRTGSPALHVGFQEFRRLRTQLDLYGRLTGEVTVHLYGLPDWEPPLDNVEYHGYSTDEIRDHWFVVYEAGTTQTDLGSCAILAQEREPNVYSGFWTGQRPLADRIIDRLRTAYPANEPFA